MGRDKLDELITDVYRAKLVYEAEMKSPEYRAKGEEDFEFIGKALAAKGYCKASEIFAEIGELVNEYLDGSIYTHDFCTYLVGLKKKYERGLRDEE